MKRILLAEDDRIILMAIKLDLEKHGYEVIPAYSGPQAVNLAITNIPDLVISDINMPGTYDGVEAVKKIIKKLSIPCILYTSAQKSMHHDRISNLKNIRYLNKNVDRKELFMYIEMFKEGAN